MIVLDQDSILKAKLTISLIIMNVVCFFITTNAELFYLLAQRNSRILEQYEVWRLFTSMFLHADYIHLFMNMFALLLYGALVENVFKKYEFLIIYFVSGFMGNIFTLLLYPPNSISVGASGAIFGLMGAAFVLIAKSNDRRLLVLAGAYVIYFIIASFEPGINTWAHLFGGAGGLLLSSLFDWRKNRYREIYD
jgi:rhomboid protease GluP